MAFGFDHNPHFYICRTQKRCFATLLLLNSLLGCIYYLHGQYLPSISLNLNSYTKQIDTNLNARQNPAVDSIRNILESEYDDKDLMAFYQLVEKEFTLGLRCARNFKQHPATTSNLIRSPQINNNTITSRYSNGLTYSLSHSHRKPKILPPILRPLRSSFYSFIINNSDVCLNETISLVIMIISKSDNYKTRDAIRRTWGSGKHLGKYSSINMKFFFLIDFDEKLSSNIRLENNLFHDIVQVELPQQYTLVTHRVLAIFEWTFRFCRSAQFLFKTDDDIFINLILLLKFTSPLIDRSNNNSFRISEMSIYGYKHYHPRVFRGANDPVGARYVVTEDEFPCGQYPDFLSGFGYLIPRKARDALVYAAYQDPNVAFRISDVYLTGILPDYLSLSRHPMPGYTIRYAGDCANFFDQPNSFACAAGLHHGDNRDVFEIFNRFWQRIRKSV